MPTSDISSTSWGGKQLRRIAFLPNSLSLESHFLTREMIYFLRQFGVSLEDIIARGLDTDTTWDGYKTRLRARESSYRQHNGGGWARNCRAEILGGFSKDSKPKLVGPDAFAQKNFIFNVCWNVDVNSQTMWPRYGPSTKHLLPAPRIDPQVEKTLKTWGMTVPDVNWLRAKYSSLSLPPARVIDDQEGDPTTYSSDEEETAQFPSSSNGRRNVVTPSSSVISPALMTPEPTTVIDNQLLYIIGEPIPTYPHIHDDWQGPSCVIAGTGYNEIQDRQTCRVPSQFPPHVKGWMTQAKEATDHWRASGLPRSQAASSPSPAEPIYSSNSLRMGSSGRFFEDAAAPEQSFMPSDIHSSPI